MVTRCVWSKSRTTERQLTSHEDRQGKRIVRFGKRPAVYAENCRCPAHYLTSNQWVCQGQLVIVSPTTKGRRSSLPAYQGDANKRPVVISGKPSDARSGNLFGSLDAVLAHLLYQSGPTNLQTIRRMCHYPGTFIQCLFYQADFDVRQVLLQIYAFTR